MRGRQLHQGLADLCSRFDVIKEVRGRGLLCGLEFAPWPATIVAHWKQTQGQGMIEFLSPEAHDLIETMPTMYVTQNLLNEFGIYAKVARSNPLVLRIQPPLTITAEEVSSVLAALETVCEGLQRSNYMLRSITGKTMMGMHEGNKNEAGRARQLPSA